eukprot:208281-Prorocentrum_minimum.AAC.1
MSAGAGAQAAGGRSDVLRGGFIRRLQRALHPAPAGDGGGVRRRRRAGGAAPAPAEGRAGGGGGGGGEGGKGGKGGKGGRGAAGIDRAGIEQQG